MADVCQPAPIRRRGARPASASANSGTLNNRRCTVTENCGVRQHNRDHKWRYGRERGKAHGGTGLSPNPGLSLGSAACSAATPALIRVRNNLQPGLAPGSQPYGEWSAFADHAPGYQACGIFQVCPAMGVVQLPELSSTHLKARRLFASQVQ
ncbi:hypothetical protein BDV33DRAFT_198257 [Aspergillus novoparasiticus]|uniref:Uncharacterized protein n=1 Tax=Aspergillus novoparasiticus TaxID=986946 RepID=A0A5N6F7I4_9EURO|nr:hypothetical protein BDV33DRAFT_198257 [Aspergillus novoparasiticus]